MFDGRGLRKAAIAVVAAVAGMLGTAASVRAAGPLFSLAIGYNGHPVSSDNLALLRFADDDAAAFYEFTRHFARRAFLLTVLDRDTNQRFPHLAAEARSPSRAELRRTVAELRAALEAAAAKGEDATVLIFYSGHGSAGKSGRAALTLLDGELGQDMLYDEVLAPLPARFIHLFVDACNAEAVVRPRDLQAAVVEPSSSEITDYFRRATLARFPHVGAIVASSTGAEAHEWDVYQSGVFTHEILSGLRGAADVDGNGRIEYSELAAFLAAANRDVRDPRARPSSVVHPPAVNPRVAILDLAELRDAAFLDGRPASLGEFYVEDGRGNRLADLRAEDGFRVRLALPSQEDLFVRNDHGELALRLRVGESGRFEELRLADAGVRARGALSSSLRRGLFAARFGPEYYRGFVDLREDLVAVELPEAGVVASPQPDDNQAPRTWDWRRTAGISLAASGAILAVTGAVFGANTWRAHQDFQQTDLERPAMEANDRYQRNGILCLGSLLAAAVAGGFGIYLLRHDHR